MAAGGVNMAGMFDKIRHLCDERGVSVSAMCKDIGISRSSITELKSGRTKTLGAESIMKIANYFNLSADYFLNNAKTFPERLCALRKERNLSPGELAREISLPEDALSLYESGEEIPDIDGFRKIADYFCVDIDYLLGRSAIRNSEFAISAGDAGLTEEAVGFLINLGLGGEKERKMLRLISDIVSNEYFPVLLSYALNYVDAGEMSEFSRNYENDLSLLQAITTVEALNESLLKKSALKMLDSIKNTFVDTD